MKLKDSLPLKIALMGVLALILLVPLAMVKDQIDDRQQAADASREEVSASWGRAQTLTGPVLRLTYKTEVVDEQKKKTVEERTDIVYPVDLKYAIGLETQLLHRSIYDVMVYGADVTATGTFTVPAVYAAKELTGQEVQVGLSDLRGVEGKVSFTLGENAYSIQNGSGASRREGASLTEPVSLAAAQMDGSTEIPFTLTYHVRGSSSLMIRPYGGVTDVEMHSDCPNPSFTGDFLPSSREVTEEGFTARWSVSKINRGGPDDTSFGVNLLQGVTQYQQTTRSAKYGILVILLVFIAGLAVELVGKKKIDLVQYLVIGLSLVLFYALVLSFSEFMNFALAYGLAALMTVAALFGYFRGILRDKTAYLLAALVALAYLLSYILLQMNTYALLAGTLVLFVLLVGIMYLTRNLNRTEA